MNYYVNSYRDRYLCHIPSLGIANDSWAHKESHDERHHVIWVLHW
jgi:hypothetical protein